MAHYGQQPQYRGAQYGGIGQYNGAQYQQYSAQYPQGQQQQQQRGLGAPPPPPPPPPAPTRSGYQQSYSGQGGYQQVQQSPPYPPTNTRDLSPSYTQQRDLTPGYNQQRDLSPGYNQQRELGSAYASPVNSSPSMANYPSSPGQYNNRSFSPTGPMGTMGTASSMGSPMGGTIHAMKQEFFVTATLDEWNRQENARNAAKAQGRAKFGRAGSLLGSLTANVESMMGGETHMVPDSVVARETADAVRQETLRVMEKKGWECLMTEVRLPQMPGQEKQQTFMTVGEHGLFMIFRVQTMRRLPSGNTETDGGMYQSCMRCFENCCAPEAPDFSQHSGNARRLSTKIESGLQTRASKVLAHIEVGDAEDMFRSLRGKNWAPEMATQTIISARQNVAEYGPGSPGTASMMYAS